MVVVMMVAIMMMMIIMMFNSDILSVGVVKQVETANLKATGDNKGGPFKRQLECL